MSIIINFSMNIATLILLHPLSSIDHLWQTLGMYPDDQVAQFKDLKEHLKHQREQMWSLVTKMHTRTSDMRICVPQTMSCLDDVGLLFHN